MEIINSPVFIVKVLKEGSNREVDEIISYLYKKYKPKVNSYIFRLKNPKINLDDIFQEVIIKFLQLVRANKFVGNSEPELASFFLAIRI
jgi:hypothetical protein